MSSKGERPDLSSARSTPVRPPSFDVADPADTPAPQAPMPQPGAAAPATTRVFRLRQEEDTTLRNATRNHGFPSMTAAVRHAILTTFAEDRPQ